MKQAILKYIAERKRYECLCAFDLRIIPRESGFRWDALNKRWFTESHSVAARLLEYADSECLEIIQKRTNHTTEWAGKIPYPENLDPMPHQMEAVRFSLSRLRSYLALDMGLGKSICAALIRNALGYPCVIVCPPFLARNLKVEFEKWCSVRVGIFAEIKKEAHSLLEYEVLIIPDSVIASDLAQTFFKIFTANRKTLLVVDEAHRFKNEKSLRSVAMYSIMVPASHHVVFMSGTPILNRPIELWPTIKNLAHHVVDDMPFMKYAMRYCAAYQDAFGWNFSGASNLKELSAALRRGFMVRMLKEDVLDLPPKTEEMVLISDALPPKAMAMEQKLLKEYSPEELMQAEISPGSHFATYRKELGVYKAKHAAKFVKDILEDTEECVLLFGIHKDAIAILEAELARYKPFVITGDTPMQKRHEYVSEFQSGNPERRLFIGNVDACGVGLTLTRATRVVFAECSWVPAMNAQATDRTHRIGQTSPVHCQFLVFQNSIDAAVIGTNLAKRRIIKQI